MNLDVKSKLKTTEFLVNTYVVLSDVNLRYFNGITWKKQNTLF